MNIPIHATDQYDSILILSMNTSATSQSGINDLERYD